MTNQERALEIIHAFCIDEYGDDDEDTRYLHCDYHRVPLACTVDDDYNWLNVYADIVGNCLIYEKDNQVVETENYDNYEEFERLALTQLDFDELIAHCNGNFGEV